MSLRGVSLGGLSKLLVLGALLVGFASAGEASTSGAAATPRLNIVFVLTDDQSIESISKMPFVSRYPNWIEFENAFINDPVCCPSRATIATGLYSHHTRIENNSDRSKFDDSSTVATWLDAAGYRTGLFGKYHLGTHGGPPTYIPPGWDDWVSFPDGAYYNYTLNENGRLVEYGSEPRDYSTDVLARKSVDFIKRADGTTPFFLYLSTRSPHDGYQPAVRYADRFMDEPIVHTPSFNEPDMSDKPSWWRALAPRKTPDIDKARHKQYASLLAVDDAVQSIFGTLDAKGLLDKTVVVFMTDNGFAFGEHRWRGKACAYEPCVRTPLLVSYPGQASRKVPQLVSNVDIAPTFADLAGAKPASPVDGRSFAPLLTGPAPANWPGEVLLRFKHDASQDTPPSFWAVRTSRYKYIETEGTGEVELYDLSTDPDEVQNVAGRAEYAQTRARLADRLAALRSASPHGSDPPQTTIDSSPSPVTGGVGLTFTFSSSETGSVFQCRLAPSGDWANCASPKTYNGLAEGPYTFEVRAIDAAGNTDPTPASRAFVLDLRPLGTRITRAPGGVTPDRTPTFRFKATGGTDLARFECSVDARSFRACTSPATVHPRLSFRRHTFRVRAVDKAGNADGSPARRTFKVVRRRA
jgi:N-acetylglucosamine-6-sulfatase